jgi:hypothetical protein
MAPQNNTGMDIYLRIPYSSREETKQLEQLNSVYPKGTDFNIITLRRAKTSTKQLKI